MQRSENIIKLIALLALTVLLVSCSPTGAPPAEQVEAPAATPEPAAEQQMAEPSPTAAVDSSPPTAEVTSEGGDEAAESAPAALPDQGPIPTGSSALKATDPASVELGDGQPKLVEFFAFW